MIWLALGVAVVVVGLIEWRVTQREKLMERTAEWQLWGRTLQWWQDAAKQRSEEG